MLRVVAALATFASASATLELTPENFDQAVFGSQRAAFIKFLAPW